MIVEATSGGWLLRLRRPLVVDCWGWSDLWWYFEATYGGWLLFVEVTYGGWLLTVEMTSGGILRQPMVVDC